MNYLFYVCISVCQTEKLLIGYKVSDIFWISFWTQPSGYNLICSPHFHILFEYCDSEIFRARSSQWIKRKKNFSEPHVFKNVKHLVVSKLETLMWIQPLWLVWLARPAVLLYCFVLYTV